MKTVESMQDVENINRRLVNAHKLLRRAVTTMRKDAGSYHIHFDGVIEEVQGELKRGYAIAIEGGNEYEYTGNAKALEILDYNKNTMYADLLTNSENAVYIPFGAKYIRPVF